MNRSKEGTYIQGVKYAECLLEKFVEDGKDPTEKFKKMIVRMDGVPSYYYDGEDYCNGFYDYIHHYIDNKELITSHFKEYIQNAKS